MGWLMLVCAVVQIWVCVESLMVPDWYLAAFSGACAIHAMGCMGWYGIGGYSWRGQPEYRLKARTFTATARPHKEQVIYLAPGDDRFPIAFDCRDYPISDDLRARCDALGLRIAECQCEAGTCKKNDWFLKRMALLKEAWEGTQDLEKRSQIGMEYDELMQRDPADWGWLERIVGREK